MGIRTLDQQFGKRKADEVRALIGRFKALEYPEGVSRYYAVDLQTTLEAGALLGSLCVGSSLLEVVVRELVLQYAQSAARPSIDLQPSLEAKKNVGFCRVVDKLSEAGLIDGTCTDSAKEFYESTRIPILHGLPRRFTDSNAVGVSLAIMRPPIGNEPVSSRDLEEVLEESAFKHIETLAEILECMFLRAL